VPELETYRSYGEHEDSWAGRFLGWLGRCCFRGVCSSTAGRRSARSLFLGTKRWNPAKDVVLANPDVTGISIRYGWLGREPSEGVYTWMFLDSEVARAAAAGKSVLLRIVTQAGKPQWVTDAVLKARGLFFTFTDNDVTTSIPVFWGPTYLAKKKTMIAALGAHFANNPRSKSFQLASPMRPARIGTCRTRQTWSLSGSPSEKMLDAGKQIVDATMLAFPINLSPWRSEEMAPAIWTLTPRTSRAMPSSPLALHGLDGFWSKSTVSPLFIRRLRVLRILCPPTSGWLIHSKFQTDGLRMFQ
jgi:hypothetical protein